MLSKGIREPAPKRDSFGSRVTSIGSGAWEEYGGGTSHALAFAVWGAALGVQGTCENSYSCSLACVVSGLTDFEQHPLTEHMQLARSSSRTSAAASLTVWRTFFESKGGDHAGRTRPALMTGRPATTCPPYISPHKHDRETPRVLFGP